MLVKIVQYTAYLQNVRAGKLIALQILLNKSTIFFLLYIMFLKHWT